MASHKNGWVIKHVLFSCGMRPGPIPKANHPTYQQGQRRKPRTKKLRNIEKGVVGAAFLRFFFRFSASRWRVGGGGAFAFSFLSFSGTMAAFPCAPRRPSGHKFFVPQIVLLRCLCILIFFSRLRFSLAAACWWFFGPGVRLGSPAPSFRGPASRPPGGPRP